MTMTFEEFAEAIAGLRSLPARERERECQRLDAAARKVLALERGRALAEVNGEGRGALAAYARELGVTRGALDQPMGAWLRSQASPGASPE